jgi:hypothetical protein
MIAGAARRTRLAVSAAAALLVTVGCGGSSPKGTSDPTAGNISGSINGTSWTQLSNAYWIGKPAMGSPPMIIFLFEAPVACSEIVNLNWDKTATGSRQILELALLSDMPRTYQIMTDVSAAYLLGDYNPDAYSGTVTLSQVDPTVAVKGSFDLHFLSDSLAGAFDAKYCPDGVEP